MATSLLELKTNIRERWIKPNWSNWTNRTPRNSYLHDIFKHFLSVEFNILILFKYTQTLIFMIHPEIFYATHQLHKFRTCILWSLISTVQKYPYTECIRLNTMAGSSIKLSRAVFGLIWVDFIAVLLNIVEDDLDWFITPSIQPITLYLIKFKQVGTVVKLSLDDSLLRSTPFRLYDRSVGERS